MSISGLEHLKGVRGRPNYSNTLKIFMKELAEGSVTNVFTLPNCKIGNRNYKITLYRSAGLRASHCVFLVFYGDDHASEKPEFILAHNVFTDNTDLFKTLKLFFKLNKPDELSTCFQQLKDKGFILIDSLKDLEARKNKTPTKRPYEDGRKVFNLAHDFFEAVPA